MSYIDIMILIIYFVVLIIIGFISSKGSKTSDEYFLANKSMPWLPVALSIAATMISANGFIGAPGWSYSDGMFPFMTNIAVPLAAFVALYVTTPVFYNLRVTSIYEYIGLRYGKFTRGLAILQFFINSIIQAGSMIYIPSLLISIITGWSIGAIVPIIMCAAILYTFLGGIKAVIYTDALQMVVIFGSIGLIIYTICSSMDIQLFELIKLTGEMGKLNALDFSLDITNNEAFLVTLVGGSVMWIRYFCFDQVQVQRVLTSKSLNATKKSLAISSIIMNIVYGLMLVIGGFLFVFYDGKEFNSANDIMIDFILNILPVGAIGLIVAGVFAACMSSVDSLLNSMSAVFEKDILEYYFKNKKLNNSSRGITLFLGILISIFAILGFASETQSIIDVVGSYISYFAGPATGIFILALATYKVTDKAASTGFILGVIGNIIIAKLFNTGWLWNPFIGNFITIIISLIITKFDKNKNKKEEIYKYTIVGIRDELQKSTNDKNMFKFGKYEKIVLSFFFIQYIVLFIIEKIF